MIFTAASPLTVQPNPNPGASPPDLRTFPVLPNSNPNPSIGIGV